MSILTALTALPTDTDSLEIPADSILPGSNGFVAQGLDGDDLTVAFNGDNTVTLLINGETATFSRAQVNRIHVALAAAMRETRGF